MKIKKVKKRKKEPRFFVCDDDGNWYLLPESKRIAFEDAINISHSDRSQYFEFLDKFDNYRIDGPDLVKILDWEFI